MRFYKANRTFTVAAILWIFSVIASNSYATPTLWTLSGTFEGGGTSLGGSFIYDPTSNSYSGINIDTTYHYEGLLPSVSSDALSLSLVTNPFLPTLLDQHVLTLSFSNPLSALGGIVDLSLGELSSEGICLDSACLVSSSNRSVADGSVSAGVSDIPLPSTWALSLIGLIALSSLSRGNFRRQCAVAASPINYNKVLLG